MHCKKLFDYDKKLRTKYGSLILGCDEVARGCWAGPIVAASVIFDDNAYIEHLNDSKKLSDKVRIKLDQIIKNTALSWAVAEISVELIDKYGINWANSQAMHQSSKLACEKIGLNLENINLFILDQSPCKSLNPNLMISKADSTSASVAAASILAKNYRNNLILNYQNLYPEYNFDKHSGYINEHHLTAVNKFGLINGVHRKSYKVSGFNKGKQINMKDFFTDEN